MPDRSRFSPAGKTSAPTFDPTVVGREESPHSTLVALRRLGLMTFFSLGLATIVVAGPGVDAPSAPSIPDLPSAPAPAPIPSGGNSFSPSDYNSSNNSRSYEGSSSPNTSFPSNTGEVPFIPHRLPIYFPPVPPRLNAHVDLPSPALAYRPAPAELALFVNDPFYAPLSTRLAENTLRETQRKRLDAYLTEKIRLQNELHAQLEALRQVDAATRERALATLAREQEPRLQALEQEAEDLRNNLVRGEPFQSDVEWNSTRGWRLGDRFYTPAAAITAQFQVMRATAFYQKGLLPAQRRLLREIAIELGDVTLSTIKEAEAEPDEPTTPSDTNPLLFFSPETARVRLPADLPPELAEKVATFEREKSRLKKDLRDTVTRHDSTYFSFTRQKAFESLARSQRAQIDALEILAEDIRRDLAQLPDQPKPPAPPELPPAMSERLGNFLLDRSIMQKNLLRMITEAGRSVTITQVAYRRDPAGHYRLNIVIDPRSQDATKVKKVQDDFAAYSGENERRNRELVVTLTELRRDGASLLGLKSDDPGAQKEIDRLLVPAVDIIEARQDWQRYSDYRTAVLEPGLSPAQRRLLFDASLAELDLPLPGPEKDALANDSRPGMRGPTRRPRGLRATDMTSTLSGLP